MLNSVPATFYRLFVLFLFVFVFMFNMLVLFVIDLVVLGKPRRRIIHRKCVEFYTASGTPCAIQFYTPAV